jgi:hypothetical protein
MKFIYTLINIANTTILILLVAAVAFFSFKNATNQPLYIESDFQLLFEAFKKDAEFYKVTPKFSGLSIAFVKDIEGDILGYCIPKFNTVKISKLKWNRIGELERKLLIYHELAHCTLLRDHTADNGFICPISIMHPIITPSVACYPSFKDWYDRELFTNPNNTTLIDEENYEIISPFSTTNH